MSGETLSDIVIVILWLDESGMVQSSDQALISYNPLLPEQESPWEAIGPTNPPLMRYRVQFKELLGGTISTRDDRAQ